MYFCGIEHGTRAIRCSILPDSSPFESYESSSHEFFEIPRSLRSEGGKEYPSIMDELGKRVDLNELKMTVMTYSMGDAFTEITNIKELKDRGVQSTEGAGAVVGLGGSIFDEIRDSELDVLAIPGIHRGTPTLLPPFRHLWSHCSAPDKIAGAYLSSLYLRSIEKPGKDFILSDVGANTVSLLVKDGKIAGGLDAALGAPGLLQGPIDLEGIREIDKGILSANETFSTAGVFSSHEFDTMRSNPDFHEKYVALVSAVAMEISSLALFLPEPEAVIISGSAHEIDHEVFRTKLERLLGTLPVHYLGRETGALGCACIARDIHYGKKEVLGIKVRLGR